MIIDNSKLNISRDKSDLHYSSLISVRNSLRVQESSVTLPRIYLFVLCYFSVKNIVVFSSSTQLRS